MIITLVDKLVSKRNQSEKDTKTLITAQLGQNELTALFLFIILLSKMCAQCPITDSSMEICVFSLYIDSYSHVLYHDHNTIHQRDFLNCFKTTLYIMGMQFFSGILVVTLICCWQALPKYLL